MAGEGEAPVIRDAHAEFRRGGWQKPATFVGMAAVLLVALFLLVPAPEDETPRAVPAEPEHQGVIGTSLAPGRTTLEELNPEDHKQAFEKTEQKARAEQDGAPPVERPADIPEERDFARAFKESAAE